MVIELLGVSGVGKTTLTKALAERLQLKGHTVRSITGQRDQLLSRTLIRGSDLAVVVAATLKTDIQPDAAVATSQSIVGDWLRGYCSHLLGQSTAGEDIVILDQGWIHASVRWHCWPASAILTGLPVP